MPESNIAPYLTSLQKRVNSEGIRIGSYPLFLKGVYVSLIGRDEKRVRELGEEVRNLPCLGSHMILMSLAQLLRLRKNWRVR